MYFKTLISLTLAGSLTGTAVSTTLSNATNTVETTTSLKKEIFIDHLKSFEKNIDNIKNGQNYDKDQEIRTETINQIKNELLTIEAEINNLKTTISNFEQNISSKTSVINEQAKKMKDQIVLKKAQKKAKNYYKWRKSWGIINPCKQKIALNPKVLEIIDKNIDKGLAILGCAVSIAYPPVAPIAAAIVLLLIKQWEYNDIKSYDQGKGVILHTYGLPGIPLYISSVSSQ